MTKQFIYIVLSVLLSLPPSVAQEKQLAQGRVIDKSNGKPVAGATLQNTDLIHLAQTDADGYFKLGESNTFTEFKLTAVGYDTLSFSLEELIKNGNVLRMTRRDIMIENISVSTGYEQFDQKSATGAFEVLGSDIINRNTGQDILSRIENMSTGLYFDKSTSSSSFSLVGRPPNHNLFLQGVSTLRSANMGASSPLIILDNFPYEGDINSVNPNDVESITILKDAASAAIWGAKAGNGVLVITTKGASKDGKFRMDVQRNLQIHDKPDLYANNVISSKDLIDLEMDLYGKGFFNSRYNARTKLALPPVVELLYRYDNDQITEDELQNAISLYQNQDVRTSMLKYMYRHSVLQQHNVRISGGNDLYKMGMSLGYDKSLATRIGDRNERLTWKLDNSLKFTDKFNMDIGLRWNIGSAERSYGSEYYSDSGYRFPYVSVADDNGNPLSIPWDYRMGYIENAGEGRLLDWQFRPLDEARNPVQRDSGNELMVDLRAKYQLLSALQLSVDYRYSRNATKGDTHYNLDHYYVRNLINRGTELTDNGTVYHFPYGGIRSFSDQLTNRHYGRMQLNLSTNIHKDHHVRAIAGMDITDSNTESSGLTMYGYNEERGLFDTSVDHQKQYPIFDNLASFGTIDYPISPYGYFVDRSVSLYFNGTYTFLDRHMLSSSIRRDASNVFGVETNNKWTPLWSMGYAYILDREEFYNVDWLPQLKLRATYGVSGNVDNSLSSYVTMSYTPNSSTWGVPYMGGTISTLPNPNLRWEKVKQLNLALDFSIGRGNRVTGSIDYFHKLTDDLLYSVPIDPTLGKASATRNIANTETTGVNVQLSSINIRRPVTWTSHLNFGYNNSWIRDTHTKYAGPSRYVNGTIAEEPGSMIYGVYSYKWAGLDHETGLPMGFVDGEKSMDYRTIMSNNTPFEDLVLHGSARPLYFGALRNNVSYKDFTLSFNIVYQFDYYFRRKGLNYANLLNNGNGHEDYNRKWQNPGDEESTHVPAFVYPLNSSANTFYLASEPLVELGDYIRLNDIRLDFNRSLRLRTQQIGVNVFAMVNNVGMIWKATKLDIDPQYNSNIPPPRYMSFGLRLTY